MTSNNKEILLAVSNEGFCCVGLSITSLVCENIVELCFTKKHMEWKTSIFVLCFAPMHWVYGTDEHEILHVLIGLANKFRLLKNVTTNW